MEARIKNLQNLFDEFVGVTKNVQVLCDARKYSRVFRLSGQSKAHDLLGNNLDSRNHSKIERESSKYGVLTNSGPSMYNLGPCYGNEVGSFDTIREVVDSHQLITSAKSKAHDLLGNNLDSRNHSKIERESSKYRVLTNSGPSMYNLGPCYGNEVGSFDTIREVVDSHQLITSAKSKESTFNESQLDKRQVNEENAVMTINLIKDSSFNETRLNQILANTLMDGKDAYPRLTNYFYYLFDDSDSHDWLDHNLDSRNHSEIEGGSSEHGTLTNNSIAYSLDSCYGNDVGSCEIGREIAQQSHSDIGDESSEYLVVTDDDMSGYNLDSCVDTRKEMVEQNQSGTGGECGKFSAGTIDQSGEGIEVDVGQKTSNATDEPDELNFMNVKSNHGCDNTKMHVATSDQGRYKKKLCCVYCLRCYPKLARHLGAVHKNEPDVKRFRALPIGSKKRRAIITKLRNLGQFEWNHNSKINGGELLTSRRPNKKFRRTAIHYKTCAKCRGIYSLNALRYHFRVCTKNRFVGERIVKQLSRAVEGRLHEDAFDDLRTIIFPKMREDGEVLCIRYDWIVITFGNDLCLNYSPHYQHAMIRTRLRNAGKLLLASRKINPDITDFASLYHVKYCVTVIEAIRKIAKFDVKSKTFQSPGTAAALVTLTNTIGELLVIESMKLEDEDKEKTVERFLKVFKKDAKLKILKIVTVNQLKARREKSENIPSTDDVCRLATFLDREREATFMELTERYSYDNWLYLAQLTMMSVLVFNRKRVGDTQNILVCDFRRREIITERCDTPQKTRDTIKSRITTRGKLYRTVPVLLKHNFEDCLDLLLRYRKDVGVTDSNDFLFGLPSKSGQIKVIDAGALFREYSKLCGAENPSSLRGTNLRKHFASLCATINLSDNDVANVSKFMGHSESVHRNVYRQNPLHQELKIATFLDFAQGKNNIDTMTANDITGPLKTNPETKRKRTKKMANVVAAKKSRKQIEKTHPEPKKKPTKKTATANVVGKFPGSKPTKKTATTNAVGTKKTSKANRKVLE